MSDFCTGTRGGWKKYPGNPVLGGSLGVCFDISMLRENERYVMYFSWRTRQSIARTVSYDGINWEEPVICIGPRETSSGWENDLNRPAVEKRGSIYYMWYTGQYKPGQHDGTSDIFLAVSEDGEHFVRVMDEPVLRAEMPWEKRAVMCPSVIWDNDNKLFRMWYSGGEQNEPNAIGYAESADGIYWKKNLSNPVFSADPNTSWEQHKTAGCQVLYHNGWYWMFYIGYHTEQYAQIGVARSKNGIDGWQRASYNPIIAPDDDSWDSDACYKPFVMYDEKEKHWRLWYNGRRGGIEQIGTASLEADDLIFE